MSRWTQLVAIALLLGLGADDARSEEPPTLKQMLNRKRDESDSERPTPPWVLSSPWAAVHDFVTYHTGPQFRSWTINDDGSWREHVQTRTLVISWFLDDGATALRYTVSDTGHEHDVRHVYNWARQADNDRQLNHDEINRLNAIVSRLPKSVAEPPINRTVLVSFKHNDDWRTETYDTERLPAEVESVFQLLGERFETRDRHKPKKTQNGDMTTDRDRGPDCSGAPPTPPSKRVRTRRFASGQ